VVVDEALDLFFIDDDMSMSVDAILLTSRQIIFSFLGQKILGQCWKLGEVRVVERTCRMRRVIMAYTEDNSLRLSRPVG